MDTKKAPVALTAEELGAVSGGSRRFVEPVLDGGVTYKFAPLARAEYDSVFTRCGPLKFAPLV